jgi:hypothetical protein
VVNLAHVVSGVDAAYAIMQRVVATWALQGVARVAHHRPIKGTHEQ